MYAKPTLVPLDLATTTASCCRVVVHVGDNTYSVTNRPLCPFPLDTGDVCVEPTSDTTTSSVMLADICAYAN